MINFKTGKAPKLNMFDFGAFQKQMPSRAKYLLHILFGAFQVTPRIYMFITENSRARSLDRLSMKSDATGSIKSQSMPDIIIFMSVASPCTSCRRPLYEEEIMAGWSHDDADYYTKCCWCNKVRYSVALPLNQTVFL